jgi:hypothetical protein
MISLTHELWEVEEAFYTNHRGVDPDKAHVFVVLRWMVNGDYRPLAAAIRAGETMDDAWLAILAKHVEEDQLQLKRTRKGRPASLDAQIRNLVAKLLYERGASAAEIADGLNISEASVRQVITAFRRSKKNNK